jgi:PAS domain S-box-containing protein
MSATAISATYRWLVRPRQVLLTVISACFFGLLVVIGIAATTTISRVREIGRQSRDLYEQPFEANAAARDARSVAGQIREGILTALVVQSGTPDPSLPQRIADLDETLSRDLDIAERRFRGDPDRVKQARAAAQDWSAARREILDRIGQGQYAEARALVVDRGTPLFGALHNQLDHVIEASDPDARALAAQVQQVSGTVSAALVPAFLGVGLMTAVFGAIVARLAVRDGRRRDDGLRESLERVRLVTDNLDLQRREARIKLAADAGGIGLWDLNLHTGILHGDARIAAIYGPSPDDAPRDYPGWRSRILPEDLPAADAKIAAALGGTERLEIRFRVRRADGDIRTIQAAAYLERDEAGRPARLLGTNEDVTARVLAEAALRESEQRFRAVVEGVVNYAMYVLDPQGLVSSWNVGAERITGYSAAEIVGRHFSVFYPEEDRGAGKPEHALAQGAGTGRFEEEGWLLRRDGSRFWASVIIKPLHNQGGDLIGFAKITRDLTERALEEELRRFIVEAAPCGMLMVDEAGTIRLANSWLERMFGYEPGTLAGREIESLVPAASRSLHVEQRCAQVGGLAARAMAPNRKVTGVRRDGQEIQVEIRLNPVETRTGHMVIASVIDVTVRHRADEVLRESEERFRSAFETAPHGMALASLEGRWLRVNAALCVMLGYSEKELLATDFQSITHPEDLGSDLAAAAALLAGEIQNHQVEKRYFDKSGAIVSVILNASLVRRPDGAPLYFVTQIQDVTERNRAQAALVQAHAEAVRAHAEAEAATRSKSEFLANMSHEIRTPMNAILGLTRLALDTDPTPKQENYLRKVDKAATALLGVLNDILDYSKIEAGKLDIDAVAFDLEDAVYGAVQLFMPAVEEKRVGLFIEIDRDVPVSLIGDPLRLGQILNNLVGNAVKFTERGEIHVTATLLDRSGVEATLQIAVSDTGIGMSPEQIDLLFQSFTQADTSITRRFGGSGLGLAICRHLVEMMGGRISAVGTEGQGSVFTFTIRALVEKDREPAPGLAGLRALVVDDQEASLAVLCDILESWRIRTMMIRDPVAVLPAIEQAEWEGDPFRLLILDWKMPELSGLEVARRIRGTAAQLPTVIMVTAHDRDHLLDEAGDCALAAILTKPVAPSLLQEAIMRSLDPSRRPVSAPAADDEALAALVQPLAGAKILLVEDNALNREVASDLLTNAGFRVDIAENGRIAVDRAAQETFDAILMDLHMPVMDGLQATRLIRATLSGQAVPIIAMSAAAMDRDRAACVEAGMNDHVAKPIMLRELFGALSQHIKPVRRAPALPAAPPTEIPVAAPAGPVKVSAFNGVRGVDGADAARRFRGDAARYRQILGVFLGEFSQVAGALSHDLGEGRKHEALETLHTLKGTAGNLAIRTIAAHAAELEAALRDGMEDTVEARLAQLGTAMEQLARDVSGL